MERDGRQFRKGTSRGSRDLYSPYHLWQKWILFWIYNLRSLRRPKLERIRESPKLLTAKFTTSFHLVE